MTVRRSRREILAAIPAVVLAACSKTLRRAGRTTPSRPTTSDVLPTTSDVLPTTVSTAPAFARFVTHGPADRPAVALTFHGSGDVGLLNQLLAVAAQHRARLTIFAVGQWLDTNPGVARQILAGGHELANHTYTHPSLGLLGRAGVEAEITKCRDALSRHGGTPGLWFRPSAVVIPSETILGAAAASGYPTVVGYDVDPRDYEDPGAALVRSRTAAGLHAGAIVSLHTGHQGTVDALSGVLADVNSRGLRPVTVSELLRP